MPLTSFTYRKCNRCELYASDREDQSESMVSKNFLEELKRKFVLALKLLIPNQSLCPLCDGFLV